MFGVDNIENKEKIAIVVIGYNRLKSIKRLLNSLLEAEYSSKDVPLVISIDCSGDEELYTYVREFQWVHGNKYVNIQDERLGLKNHIFQCISLSQYFKGVVLLEDDLFVSPYFYNYVECVIQKYGDDDRIGEISLYNHEENGFVGIPFSPVYGGSDVYLAQGVSTWGECFTHQMWVNFQKWYESHQEDDFLTIDMLDEIKRYKRAWSKYYNAYLVSTGRFVVFPYQSLITNFSDAGEHGGANNSIVQVSLLQGKKKYQLEEYENLIKYDIYLNNKDIANWLNFEEKDLVVDFYGTKEKYDRKFLLTPFKLPFKVIRGFALNMRPWELNIKYSIEGGEILLYELDEGQNERNIKKYYPSSMHKYFLRRYSLKYLMQYVIKSFICRVKNKIVK